MEISGNIWLIHVSTPLELSAIHASVREESLTNSCSFNLQT
jgi:hypothetical protein